MFIKKAYLIITVSFVVIFFIFTGISGASIANPYTMDLATLVGQVSVYTPPANCYFNGFSPNALTEAQVPTQDPMHDYPFGLVEFQLNCITSPAVVTLTFTSNQPPGAPIDLSGRIYRKYGPTPADPTPHWYDFMYDGQTGAQINGNVVTLHFIEGARGDDDLGNINGIIIDQGGPTNRISIPTMTEWGMIIFMVFAGIVSIYYFNRRRRTG